MSEYIKSIVSAVIAVGLITTLFSKNSFSKYINLLSSIIVMAVLILPVVRVSFEPMEFSADEVKIEKNRYLQDEFEKVLQERIKEELKRKTGKDFEVLVSAEVTDDAKIQQIKLSPYSEEYAKIVREYLGFDENGAKINER